MKKICMITTVSSTMKSFVVETAKHLHRECGYDVTLICNQDEDFANSLPEYIHYIPVKMARGINLSGFSAISEFRRIFKKEKFDLVQYSTPNASCYASIAAKKEKVPVRLYCQWGIRYVGLSGLSRKIFKTLERMVCRNSTHIRAVSPMNMAFAVQEGLYAESKAKVVGNGGTIGVDTELYDIQQKSAWRADIRAQYNLEEKEFVFGFAGRVSVDKGCGELLTAFRQIAKETPHSKLLIVGPMEENCGIDAELISWAKESDRVVLTGKVDNHDMRRFYAAMDVLVHPTYREGFGMVIQEAGALAVPVITTNIPGASEVMETGISCLLVEPKDAIGLADTMKRILLSPEETILVGQKAYERTVERYSRPIMLAHQQEDYENLMERG